MKETKNSRVDIHIKDVHFLDEVGLKKVDTPCCMYKKSPNRWGSWIEMPLKNADDLFECPQTLSLQTIVNVILMLLEQKCPYYKI